MTVSEQQTEVSKLLADPNSNQWDQSDHILPALNVAQDEFVIKILSYGRRNDNVFDILTELQTNTTQSIGTTGYALSGLNSDPGPFIRNGYVSSKCTIDNEVRWITRISASEMPTENNRYTKGNDERPKCYIWNNTYYLLVDLGSYPISTTIYFIREPKELVASGASGYQVATCEINPIYHSLINKMAMAECYRMRGDATNMAKYTQIFKETESMIQRIALGGVIEPKDIGVESA